MARHKAALSLRIARTIWQDVKDVVHYSAHTGTSIVEDAINDVLGECFSAELELTDPYTGRRFRKPVGEEYPPMGEDGLPEGGPQDGVRDGIAVDRTTLYLTPEIAEQWRRHVYWTPPHWLWEATERALVRWLEEYNAEERRFRVGKAARVKPPGEAYPPRPHRVG